MDVPSLAIYAWFALAPLLFGWLPARRAIVAGYVLAFSFLPVALIDTPFVDVDKYVATSLGIVIGLAILGVNKLHRWKLAWWDLPILAWTIVPLFTSISNDLGFYDGISASTHRALIWTVPYALARMYLSDREGLRELAIGVFLGGLLYVPFCLFEIRMSPRLHLDVYGYHQHAFLQTIRTIGGYRPMVFMHHGLMVGLWMSMATLVGFVLWRTRTFPKFLGIPTGWLVALVGGTALLGQSFGALVLLGAGLLVWWGLKRSPRLAIGLLVALPVTYCVLRVDGLWGGSAMVEMTRQFSDERADSLEYRLEQEEILAQRAWESPILGWGGYNRAFPPPNGSEFRPAVSDSLWIVTFGMNGLLGLVAIGLALVAPLLAFARAVPPRLWRRAEYAPAAVLAVVVGLYFVDGMVNMMINPIFMLAAGATVGWAARLEAAALVRAREARVSPPTEPVPARTAA